MSRRPNRSSVTHINTWKAYALSGYAMTVALLVGQVALMRFVPPPSPLLSAEEIKQIFLDRQVAIRIGSLIITIGWVFWITYGVSIILFIRKMERGWPVITYGALAVKAAGYFPFMFCPLTWAVLSFRTEAYPAELILFANDYIWFLYLFTWPLFSVIMFLVAIAILNDHNVPSIYPRWVGYYNLWSGIFLCGAGMIVFTKEGPLAYDGLIGFWIVTLEWFAWSLIMIINTVRLIDKVRDGKLRLDSDVPKLDPKGTVTDAAILK